MAAEQVKLALEAIGLQERKALEHFYAAVRKATPQVRILAERYGGDVAFSFDSTCFRSAAWPPDRTLFRRTPGTRKSGAAEPYTGDP